MRIDVVRLSVGRPAGVADSDCPGRVLPLQEVLEIGYFALALEDVDLPVVPYGSDSGAVIAPVFESMQTLEYYRTGLSASDISYYATHKAIWLRMNK